ncbi:hypothetical protein JXB31_00930 [Candidatus Woesearchaeota archaeon]|nr:hypothetical protein [Candidatus Woesearchaeota archaeon]
MNNHQKKAQGALEFLMTYGWAFLVILIMIGALAYFGVLNPSRFLPDRCQFATPLLCKTEQFTVKSSADATVIAKVINNFGSRIYINDATITTDSGAITNGQCDVCFDGAANPDGCGGVGDENISGSTAIEWEEGSAKFIVADCPGGADLGGASKVKFIFSAKYYPVGSSSTFEKDLAGEIYATAQD